MHRISPKNAKAAQKHAQTAKQHGQLIEALAQELQQSTDENAEEIQQILKQGRSIQDHAEASGQYAAIVEQDDRHSTDAYVLAVKEHVIANRKHIEAIRGFLKIAGQLPPESKNSDL